MYGEENLFLHFRRNHVAASSILSTRILLLEQHVMAQYRTSAFNIYYPPPPVTRPEAPIQFHVWHLGYHTKDWFRDRLDLYL